MESDDDIMEVGGVRVRRGFLSRWKRIKAEMSEGSSLKDSFIEDDMKFLVREAEESTREEKNKE